MQLAIQSPRRRRMICVSGSQTEDVGLLPRFKGAFNAVELWTGTCFGTVRFADPWGWWSTSSSRNMRESTLVLECPTCRQADWQSRPPIKKFFVQRNCTLHGSERHKASVAISHSIPAQPAHDLREWQSNWRCGALTAFQRRRQFKEWKLRVSACPSTALSCGCFDRLSYCWHWGQAHSRSAKTEGRIA